MMERFKQVARCHAHFAAMGDGAEVVATESQARRSLEMLVHTEARSCRSRATARRAKDAQGEIQRGRANEVCGPRTRAKVVAARRRCCWASGGGCWSRRAVRQVRGRSEAGSAHATVLCVWARAGWRVGRRVVKNTQRNSRRCLRQGIAAVRQVRGRASEDYREVVMVREGTVR